MFGFGDPKLPITSEDRQWTDRSILRLAELLGSHRLLQATVVLPTPEHFPDPFDRSEASLQRMFDRVAVRMEVDPAEVDVTLFVSEYHMTQEIAPLFSGKGSGAAGLCHHDTSERVHISVDESNLKDPMALVAVLAHELGHIILLRPGLVDREAPDMEPMNDLLTVFLGLGIFTANSVFRFQQYTEYDKQGWSANRLGYLTEQQFGYALARFAYEREERKPAWAKYLSKNVASYMKRSVAWLEAQKEPRLLSKTQDRTR